MLANARALVEFVPGCAVLFSRLIRDRCISRRQRLALIGLGLYLASPIDLVPDFIPVIGQIDDAILVALALRRLLRSCGVDELASRWPGGESSFRLVLRLAGAGVNG